MTEAAARSALFAGLAAGFRYLARDLGDAVGSGELRRRLEGAVADLPGPPPVVAWECLSGATQGELEGAYVTLFDVGDSEGAPCFLDESARGGSRVGVMADLLRFYHFFGLRLTPLANGRPDHLATELEFLHYLGCREAEALAAGRAQEAAACGRAAGDFLAAHAADLAAQVCARLRGRSAGFYRELAALADWCCRREPAAEPRSPSPAGGVAPSPAAGPAPSPAGGPAPLPSSAAPQLHALFQAEPAPGGAALAGYDRGALRRQPLAWDRVVRCSHLVNCAYQQACNYHVFVSDGVALREEQVGDYPAPRDPEVPDFNPRGCQKGGTHVERMYDPMRVRYPLKRVGERGGGRWQRLSWDQALTEIADGLIDILAEAGPEVVVQGGGTQVQTNSSDATALTAFFDALGTPTPNVTHDNGDDHQGAAVTFGKVILADSADNWFHSDLILVWGGNPAYTNIPNFHYITEARYHGTRVVTIAPDYNASCPHADEWVPVRVGSDAALALGMAGVILREGLQRTEFVREQTDLPLLVRRDNGLFLRERDMVRGGRDDIFYVWDEAGGRLAPAPRRTLALGDLVPALDGEFTAGTLEGPVAVRPVMAVLREKLDAEYRPEQAAAASGVAAGTIERLAREFARARGVVNIPTYNWGRFYHGDLIERAIILLFALCGHIGRRGASYNAFAFMGLDTAIGDQERRGDDLMLAVAGADPRYAAWKEDGYTDEMILYEYVHAAYASGAIMSTSLLYFLHGGLLEEAAEHRSWDPHLGRPLGDYVQEALDRGWQYATPPLDKPPQALFQVGGNFLRRARSTRRLMEEFLPKLKLLVTVDWRLSSTALHSDYVLPACSWYEHFTTLATTAPLAPFAHVVNQAVEPFFESKTEWELFVLLARKVAERARERGTVAYRDGRGVERRLDRLPEKVTFGGLYGDTDDEAVARDFYTNARNVEAMPWEEFKERGIAAYTGVGRSMRSIGNATDIAPGEPLVPLTWHTAKKQPYPTLTRRIQFHVDQPLFLELGEALPTHKEPPAAGGDHPLVLTGGHARWSIHTMHADDALMLRLQRGEPLLFLNASDAASRGIVDGERIEAFNDVGRFSALAAVAPGVRPGQVIMYHAWENFQFEAWQHFKAAVPSPLNPVELAGDYGHIRPITMANCPGFSDRGTRLEVRRCSRDPRSSA